MERGRYLSEEEVERNYELFRVEEIKKGFPRENSYLVEKKYVNDVKVGNTSLIPQVYYVLGIIEDRLKVKAMDDSELLQLITSIILEERGKEKEEIRNKEDFPRLSYLGEEERANGLREISFLELFFY